MNSGKITTNTPGGSSTARNVHVQADGKIVVTGLVNWTEMGQTYSDIEIARFLPNGQLDLTYSDDGRLDGADGKNSGATSSVIQADGKIVVVTNALVDTLHGSIMVRYNVDGTLDTDFGTDGNTYTFAPIGAYTASSMTILDSGKILLAGFGEGIFRSKDFMLSRYNSDGTFDTTFFHNLTYPYPNDFTPGVSNGSEDISASVTVQSDGKILVAGTSTITGGKSTFAVARYNEDGHFDESFGDDGRVTTAFSAGTNDASTGTSIVSLPDGKFLVAGNVRTVGTWKGGVARYNDDGSLDTSFGNNGLAGLGATTEYHSAALQSDGSILVAGSVGEQFALTRFTANGVLDAVTTTAMTGIAEAYGITVQADGKILVTGDSYEWVAGSLVGHITVVRYNADLSLDTTFYNTADSSASYTLPSFEDNLILTGTDAIDGIGNAGHNNITGNGAANVLDGGNGNDMLDGGLGADTLIGGTGNDIYIVDDSADQVIETSTDSAEIDTVMSSVSYVLGATLENLTLTGTALIDGSGNASANHLSGNSAANTLDGGDGDDALDGGAGVDTLIGGNGSDTYLVDNLGDVVVEMGSGAGDIDTIRTKVSYTLPDTVENITLLSSGTATGNALDNVLTAGSATLVGGLGNDTYVLSSRSAIVIETSTLATEIDTVLASSSTGQTFTLAANVENLTLTGTTAINGSGNGQANVIIGNEAANTLNGGLGADTLIGGMGNDSYVVDNVGDVVIETSTDPSQIDLVTTSVHFTLGDNLENLTVALGSVALNGYGNSLNNVLTGNSGVNLLDGGDGDDTLNGAFGADTLVGGLGNDTYVIDNANDVIIESSSLATEIDTVQSSVAQTLGANLENLTLTNASSIAGTGNALDNKITGNAGANVLNGGLGADILIGGAGNDTYVVDNAGDTVTETSTVATEIDLVQASVSFTLSNNLDNLTLTGSAAIDGTGNAGNNTLTGNAAANVLGGGAGADIIDGGLGADTMIGGNGGDTYTVDDVNDVVVELAEFGGDLVKAALSYTLGDNVESLTLTGTGAFNGTGNVLVNTLTGNTGANVLNGGAGNDTLSGGAGNDVLIAGDGQDNLTGGTGADTFVFASEDTIAIVRDTITDFKSVELDKIDLSQIDANSLLAGDQAFTFVTAFNATDATGQMRFVSGSLHLSTDADVTAEYIILLTGVTTFAAPSLIL